MKKEILAATAMVTLGLGMARAESLESLKVKTESFQAAAVASVSGMRVPQFVLSGRVGIPLHAKDAFKGLEACGLVDSYNKPVNGHGLGALPPNSSVAIDLFNPCLKAVSRRYGVKLQAQSAFMQPQASGAFQSHIMREGIEITVRPAKLPIGNSVVQDLRFSLDSRNGVLFGYPVRIVYGQAQ